MSDTRALIEAVTHHAWKEEYWAHAVFFYDLTAAQQRELGLAGPHPWRGILTPSLLHVIHVLEEMNLYDAPVLPEGDNV